MKARYCRLVVVFAFGSRRPGADFVSYPCEQVQTLFAYIYIARRWRRYKLATVRAEPWREGPRDNHIEMCDMTLAVELVTHGNVNGDSNEALFIYIL